MPPSYPVERPQTPSPMGLAAAVLGYWSRFGASDESGDRQHGNEREDRWAQGDR